MARRFRSLVCVLLLAWSAGAGAVIWMAIEKSTIVENARFIGTVNVVSGEALPVDDSDGVCAVRYTARVNESALGPDAGSTVELIVLKDHRDDMNLGFLEVGSEYFLIAGSSESHVFYGITDIVFSRDEELIDCAPVEDAFYVFQEFSSRVQMHIEPVVSNYWLLQIAGIRDLESYYRSDDDSDFDMTPRALTERERLSPQVRFLALPLDTLLEYFSAHEE